MTLLFGFLLRIPAVRRLQDERDELQAEQSSARLKLRAASAEMGVLEEQCRVLQRERDQLTETLARQAREHASEVEAALAETTIAFKERDDLGEEHRVLTAQRDALEAERDELARVLAGLRATARSSEAAR